ncbi:MAG: UDP-N-acetylmuramate dehydrogenase, partial [Anaerovorax sp.]
MEDVDLAENFQTNKKAKTGELYEELRSFIPEDRLHKNQNMKGYISFKTDGMAALFVVLETEEELSQVIRLVNRENIEHFFLGNGSNVLIGKSGYDGVMIKLGDAFSRIETTGTQIKVGSGALLSSIARDALEHSLTGLEFASGIPGSLGGAVAMNAGAYGGEMKQVLLEAYVMDQSGQCFTLKKDEMDLGYRHSVFQAKGYMIIHGILQLQQGNQEEIRGKMWELMKRRNEKQPVNLPSAGSFFKRPKGYYAGKLIEDAKLKGLSLGGAQVSPLHAGFIVNQGGATAQDIIDLMVIVQNTVRDEFHV